MRGLLFYGIQKGYKIPFYRVNSFVPAGYFNSDIIPNGFLKDLTGFGNLLGLFGPEQLLKINI
jgi:hypothetical protein